MVHGASGTGLTVFVEPLEAIEFNNRLVQLGEEELAEIARILAALTDHLRMDRGPLEYAAKTDRRARFSFCTRAPYARELDCAVPQFTTGFGCGWMRHEIRCWSTPLRPRGRAVAVPVTLALGKDRRQTHASEGNDNRGDGTVMVISGPNTDGKTVALKTVGLAALAGQSGIPVHSASGRAPGLRPRPCRHWRRAIHYRRPIHIFSAHAQREVHARDRLPFAIPGPGGRIGHRHGAGRRRGAGGSVAGRISRMRGALTHRHHPSRPPENLRFHNPWNRQRRRGIR